ncbi:hypothetical protein OA92_20155 [Marinomonas sp. SBI22]|uniref:hypothetical protein n=1 Tax=unclassified Marinomonas TaxID=196814 RepID=UPI0007AF9B75|nr:MULTISPECIES: hypothetical protein [unclassified Marinomonas]KZM39600.1 hypothetical protein OA92_20155 [Marinomonas sp. SBI22]KZM41831.1 hypothetical protein OA91_15175 [Marinomonas sp. SBI8L]
MNVIQLMLCLISFIMPVLIYLGFINYPELILKDDSSQQDACTLFERVGTFKVWWNNGPQHYVASYSHTVKYINSSADYIAVKINWMNQFGGIEKSETISDSVNCKESDRRSTWTFSITAEQAEFIKKSTADSFGPIKWNKC